MDKRKLESLAKAWVPGAETVLAPQPDEVVVIVAIFDAGLRISCVELVARVLLLYKVELAQLTPNSLMRLAVFEWIIRSAGTSGEGSLFVYLHDWHCQSKKKKNTGETLNFGSVNFHLKAQYQMYTPAPVV